MTSPFTYARATDEQDAVRLAAHPGAAFLAGGTDLLQLWKAGLAAPSRVIDIGRLVLDRIEVRDDVLVIGALTRLADAAGHPSIRCELPGPPRPFWPALRAAGAQHGDRGVT
jgi:xanthine dehydrogenase YagS FAD-binding subunit